MNTSIGVVVSISVLGFIVYLLSGNWKKVLMVVGGWGVYEFLNILYDFILWPIIQNKYGDISVVYLTLGALVLNFLLLSWYQAHNTDWLGMSYIQEIKDKGHEWAEKIHQHNNWFIRIPLYVPAKFFQFVIWLLKKNDISAFLFLSIYKDSFLTTAFLRHGKFGPLQKRDYYIFISSTLISCLVWGAGVRVGLLFGKAIMKIVFG